jgi:hypothetical protein
MGGRPFASFEIIISALVLVGYFLFSPSRAAVAQHFVPLAWVPFLIMLAAYKYLDRHQWAALRVARMVLLERHGQIDPVTAQAIQTVLIPHRVAPVMALYQLMFVSAFALLLFYQGWLTAILTFLGVFVLGIIVSSFSVALPSVGAKADRRCLRTIHRCLERRLLVQPGEVIIPDITRFELHRAVGAIVQNPATLQAQYFSALRAAQ